MRVVPTSILIALLALLAGCATINGAHDYTPLPPGDLLARYDADLVEALAAANAELGTRPLTYERLDAGLTAGCVTATGSHYELGRTLGTIFRDHGRGVRRVQSPDRELNREMLVMYAEIYPQYLALIRGIAKINGMEPEEVDLVWAEHNLFIGSWWDILDYDEFRSRANFSGATVTRGSDVPNTACSVVALQIAGPGGVVVGRNFDNDSFRPHFIVSTAMDGSYKVIGKSCYAPYHWVTDGVNEHGLFAGVASNSHPARYYRQDVRYPAEPAVQVIHMIRICLETCRTVDQAAALFSSVRIWFPCEVNHILLADASGAMAVVEFSQAHQAVVFHATEPFMVLTNTAYQEGEAYLMENCSRYRTATRWLVRHAARADSVNDLIESLRASGGSRTLWTTNFNLNDRSMTMALLEEDFREYHKFALE